MPVADSEPAGRPSGGVATPAAVLTVPQRAADRDETGVCQPGMGTGPGAAQFEARLAFSGGVPPGRLGSVPFCHARAEIGGTQG